jgi:uncharacterized protein YuzE
MRLAYHATTDSLYIDLAEATSTESVEVSEGVILDYDAMGRLVGIDIDNASRKVELQRLVLTGMQRDIERAASERTPRRTTGLGMLRFGRRSSASSATELVYSVPTDALRPS